MVVEFDDGDSGRIAIEDIRFLTCDYPVMGKNKYSNFMDFFFVSIFFLDSSTVYT